MGRLVSIWVTGEAVRLLDHIEAELLRLGERKPRCQIVEEALRFYLESRGFRHIKGDAESKRIVKEVAEE